MSIHGILITRRDDGVRKLQSTGPYDSSEEGWQEVVYAINDIGWDKLEEAAVVQGDPTEHLRRVNTHLEEGGDLEEVVDIIERIVKPVFGAVRTQSEDGHVVLDEAGPYRSRWVARIKIKERFATDTDLGILVDHRPDLKALHALMRSGEPMWQLPGCIGVVRPEASSRTAPKPKSRPAPEPEPEPEAEAEAEPSVQDLAERIELSERIEDLNARDLAKRIRDGEFDDELSALRALEYARPKPRVTVTREIDKKL